MISAHRLFCWLAINLDAPTPLLPPLDLEKLRFDYPYTLL